MEPTANAPRHSASRATPATPSADSAPADSLSSWEGPGTAYTVIPRPAAPSSGSAWAPVQAHQTEAQEASSAIKRPLPTPVPSMNGMLTVGIIVCTLLGVLAVALCKPLGDGGQTPQVGVITRQEEKRPALEDDSTIIPASEPVPDDLSPDLPDPAAPGTLPPAEAPTVAEAPTAVTPPRAQHKEPPALPQARKSTRKELTSSPRNAMAPAATGTLIVIMHPWGEVWIDGRKRGFSPPQFRLQLPPGCYQVELRNPGRPSHVQRLQIPSGQSVTLRHDFLQAPAPTTPNADSP